MREMSKQSFNKIKSVVLNMINEFRHHNIVMYSKTN